MLIGQQVRVNGERGPLKGLVGTVEEALWEEGRSWWLVRAYHPELAAALHYWYITDELEATV